MERSRVPDLDIIAGAYFPYAAEPAPARPSVPALPFQTLPAQEGAPWPEPRRLIHSKVRPDDEPNRHHVGQPSQIVAEEE